MYEQTNYPGLPGMIYAWADAVERRDEPLFKAIARVAGSFIDSSQGMTNAIFCRDGDADVQVLAGPEDIEAYPVLGTAMARWSRPRGASRDVPGARHGPAGRCESAPVETDIPALLIAGDMDPITPPPLAKAVLPGFSNGTYVEFPYGDTAHPARSSARVTCSTPSSTTRRRARSELCGRDGGTQIYVPCSPPRSARG